MSYVDGVSPDAHVLLAKTYTVTLARTHTLADDVKGEWVGTAKKTRSGFGVVENDTGSLRDVLDFDLPGTCT